MIWFFIVIIIFNLIAWLYTRKELSKIRGQLKESKDVIIKIYEQNYKLYKENKESKGKSTEKGQ